MPWRLTVEINIPYDVLITGYFVVENNLANTCMSTTIFAKTDSVALALWASIDRIFKICTTLKFSYFVVRDLLSAGGPFRR